MNAQVDRGGAERDWVPARTEAQDAGRWKGMSQTPGIWL